LVEHAATLKVATLTRRLAAISVARDAHGYGDLKAMKKEYLD
jgi:hypothetical protein